MEKMLGYLEQYNQGTYQAFKYANMKEVISSCSEGKTFVFKGGKGFFSCECYCPVLLGLIFTIVGFVSINGLVMVPIGFGFLALAVFVLVSKFRSFIVAGPDGLAYRFWTKPVYYDWSNIQDIHTTNVIGGASAGVFVRILSKDSPKPKTINTDLIRSKEFSWAGRGLMIAQVIYAHWAIKTKVQGKASVDSLLKNTEGPSDLKDPTAPM